MKTTPSALAEMLNLPKDGKFYTFDITAIATSLPTHFEHMSRLCGKFEADVKEWKSISLKETAKGQTSIRYDAVVEEPNNFAPNGILKRDFLSPFFVDAKVKKIIFEYIVENYKF